MVKHQLDIPVIICMNIKVSSNATHLPFLPLSSYSTDNNSVSAPFSTQSSRGREPQENQICEWAFIVKIKQLFSPGKGKYIGGIVESPTSHNTEGATHSSGRAEQDRGKETQSSRGK